MHALRQRFTHFWPALLFAVIYIISQGQIASILRDGGAEELLIQFQLTYWIADFKTLIASLNAEQLAALQAHFRWDWMHPLWYGAMFISLTSWQLNRKGFPDKASKLLWLAVLMPVMDLIENALHQPLFLNPQLLDIPITGAMVFFAAACATLKWLLALYFVLLNLALAFAKPRKAAANKTQPQAETEAETEKEVKEQTAASESTQQETLRSESISDSSSESKPEPTPEPDAESGSAQSDQDTKNPDQPEPPAR